MRITRHRPKHIDQTQNPYFVTGRTYFGLPYFDTDEKKELALLRAINLACEKYRLALDAWVILDNHYHLLFRPPGCTWEMEIAGKPAISKGGRNSDFSAKGGSASGGTCDQSELAPLGAIEDHELAPLGAIEDFRIGKVVGTIHGKSSSLLKKIADPGSRAELTTGHGKSANSRQIADKSAISEKVRNSELARDQRSADKSAISRKRRSSKFTCDSSYAAWSSAKYWEEIKRRNITLYGDRSQLAEEKHAKEFQRLLNGIADKSANPSELADFVRKINRVWYQYTDHMIRDEKDYWIHFNYIHQNSVKHGYVEDMAQYHFSSYNRYLKEKGKKWLADCFARYPIVDFMPKGIAD